MVLLNIKCFFLKANLLLLICGKVAFIAFYWMRLSQSRSLRKWSILLKPIKLSGLFPPGGSKANERLTWSKALWLQREFCWFFWLGSSVKSDISHGHRYRSCAIRSPGSTNVMISDVNTSAVRWIRMQNMLRMLVLCQPQEDKQYRSQNKVL